MLENYRSLDGLFYNISSEVSCASCIVIELDPKALDIGKIFSHEGGHGTYDVKNARSYFQWLKKIGLDYPEYGGHHREDPSGREAKSQEDIYITNRRNSPY